MNHLCPKELNVISRLDKGNFLVIYYSEKCEKREFTMLQDSVNENLKTVLFFKSARLRCYSYIEISTPEIYKAHLRCKSCKSCLLFCWPVNAQEVRPFPAI